MESFIINPKEKTLKESIESIERNALITGNAKLSSQIGVIKGLYSAYEMAPNEALLEKIATDLAKIIEELLEIPPQAIEVPLSIERSSGDVFDEFQEYLDSKGMTQSTSAVYVRSVRRMLKEDDKKMAPELYDKISTLKRIISSPEFDIYNRNIIGMLIDIITSIIRIKLLDANELEKSRKDHGTGLSALKRFKDFLFEFFE